MRILSEWRFYNNIRLVVENFSLAAAPTNARGKERVDNSLQDVGLLNVSSHYKERGYESEPKISWFSEGQVITMSKCKDAMVRTGCPGKLMVEFEALHIKVSAWSIGSAAFYSHFHVGLHS